MCNETMTRLVLMCFSQASYLEIYNEEIKVGSLNIRVAIIPLKFLILHPLPPRTYRFIDYFFMIACWNVCSIRIF
jgi:hypothetical protein